MINITSQQLPIGIRTYYKLNKESVKDKLEVVKNKLYRYLDTNKISYDKVKSNAILYSREYGFNIDKYKEFVSNTHIDGEFLSDVKILFDKDEKDRNNKFALLTILRYANTLKPIFDLKHQIDNYNRILKLSLKEYTEIVNKYYVEVQKNLILKGKGYEFPNKIGFLCINRCKLQFAKRKLDFMATTHNKEKLILEGIELFDKKKAEYCKKHNIEYNGVDYRIYKNDDYVYEFALCYPHITGGFKEKFEPADYRGLTIRGKSNKDLIKETNGDIEKIMNLDIDMRTKLLLCLDVNKMLYTKFIRNDGQFPLINGKVDRQD